MRQAAFVLVFAVAAFATNAAAQPSDRERAQTHFQAGRKLRASKRCDLAIDEFTQSIELEPGVGAYLNLGDCYEITGRLVEAFGSFKSAEAIARRDADDRLDEARRDGARVEARLVRVVVRDDTSEAMLTIDGAAPIARPWTVVVTPDADHVLVATTPDGRRWHEHVNGHAGDVIRLTMTLALPATVPTPPPPAPAPIPEKHENKGFPLPVLVTAGAGAAALIAGAVFGGLALSDRSDLAHAVGTNASCHGGYPNGTCDPSARAALDPLEGRTRTVSTVSTVAFALGGVLVASAVLYWRF